MGKRFISFAGKSIVLDFDHTEAEQLIDFLFCDLQKTESETSVATLKIRQANNGKGTTLYSGNRRCYDGDSRHALADTLINETIHYLIKKNKQGHMLHAAALSFKGKGILIPGKSGAGKSTLAALLTYHGYNYLTDELVSISNKQYRIHPFTRPICLKAPAVSSLLKRITFNRQKTLCGDRGLMIPHRLLNTNHFHLTPPATVILFPNFTRGHKTLLTKLSGAQSGLKLMACHVNARNLKDHGFSEMAEFARRAQAFALTYGDFEGVQEAIQSIL